VRRWGRDGNLIEMKFIVFRIVSTSRKSVRSISNKRRYDSAQLTAELFGLPWKAYMFHWWSWLIEMV
jgi:hypothetical protein